MKLRHTYLALATVALLLILGACTQDTEPPPPTDAIAESPLLPTESPLIPTPTPALLPRDHTPSPDLGIVQGELELEGEPAAERTMYLAPLVSTGGEMEVAALDPVTDPRAESDASGYFVFLDVEPGRYALGINSPIGPVLIRGDDGGEILAEVEGGQITDLGVVQIVSFNE